ncbi:beta-galactosidase [Ischnura elegans]|uniref:beta-galactosidase n=1 Tax=Ischnura elegans TaxID=197161 RepID=UPI001ED8950C|nr:beta-galactosidase [Ischnura elegans]XP_046387724.1 beta-galactosidase [Ischnura elegans]
MISFTMRPPLSLLALPLLTIAANVVQSPSGVSTKFDLDASYIGREFRIDYEGNQFLRDGLPFRYVSGSLHYFRVPEAYWRDRLHKLRAAGLNAVSTYVDWGRHEPSPGEYVFTGDMDLVRFIQTAQEEDLLVILRPGPYICAERDMGGFPPWLLVKNPNMKLRTRDSSYRGYVSKWFSVLLPTIKPFLYGNGGPIIMVQVENEYGSFPACDFDYTTWLRDEMKQYIGTAAVLFTTDGNSDGYLKCGKIAGVYATVDFGSGADVASSFRAMRNHEPRGPLVNSEFYPGWLDHWESPHSLVSSRKVADTLNSILATNASVNIYVFFGGTNFGFSSGAEFGSYYNPQPTSYDYDAPLNEAGDATEKYFAIKDVVSNYLPPSHTPPPSPIPAVKLEYGPIILHRSGSLFDAVDKVSEPGGPVNLRGLGGLVTSEYPLSFEKLHQSHGFVLYETRINRMISDPALLQLGDLRDRAHVFIDTDRAGILSRTRKLTSLPIHALVGQKLRILVENQGRINYGTKIYEHKGIVNNVTLGGKVLKGWNMYRLPFNDTSLLDKYVDSTIALAQGQPPPACIREEDYKLPSFYYGFFVLPQETSIPPQDTYLSLDGWHKGVAFINGHNLGRYWPVVGPQATLFVPGVYMQPPPATNRIILFELEKAPCNGIDSSCYVNLVSQPIINGPTPGGQ